MTIIRRFSQTAQCSIWEHTCLLLNWDSTAERSRDVRSTWPRSLTALGKLWSSTLAVRQMSSLMPVARLQKWMMTTHWWQDFVMTGDPMVGPHHCTILILRLANGALRTKAKGDYPITLLLWSIYTIGFCITMTPDLNAMTIMLEYQLVISGKCLFVKRTDCVDALHMLQSSS